LTVAVLLDSTFLIAAERRGLSATEALLEVDRLFPSQDIGLSVITVMELAHGEARSETPARAAYRSEFLSEIMALLEIHPVTSRIARRAGLLDGELAKQGLSTAFPDLIIGVTALELGYSILTNNLRHFQRIPGLTFLQHGEP
jgi:predicted nucleic acid-binding protein